MFLDIWKTRNLVHRSQYFKIQSFNGLFVCHNFFNFNLFILFYFISDILFCGGVRPLSRETFIKSKCFCLRCSKPRIQHIYLPNRAVDYSISLLTQVPENFTSYKNTTNGFIKPTKNGNFRDRHDFHEEVIFFNDIL